MIIHKALPAALLALTVVSNSYAKDFKLPEENPTCTITFPDSWKPEAYEDPVDGVSGQTEDAAVFICAEVIDSKSVGTVMEQGMKWFNKNGVKIDKASMKEDDKFIVNGIDGSLFSWDGKDSDGPCVIQMAVMPTAGDKGILVEYWASPDAEKTYGDQVVKIMRSITPVKADADAAAAN